MRKDIKEIIKEYKTISITKEDNPTFLSIESYTCKLNNGRIIKREKILKNNQDGSAVIIYPITTTGKIILTIEPRVFTTRTVDIGLPSGYIELNEKPIDAAKRELQEETGYFPDEIIFLGSFYQDQGCSSAYNHYYLALNCKKVSKQSLDDSEYIKYIEVTPKELNKLLEEGYIGGLNSAYAILESKKYLKKLRRK